MNNELIERLEGDLGYIDDHLHPLDYEMYKHLHDSLSLSITALTVPSSEEVNTALHTIKCLKEIAEHSKQQYWVKQCPQVSDLIERLQRENASQKLANKTGPESYEKEIDRLKRAIQTIKRTRPTIAAYNALSEECDGRMEAIRKMQQRIERLTQQRDFHLDSVRRHVEKARLEIADANLRAELAGTDLRHLWGWVSLTAQSQYRALFPEHYDRIRAMGESDELFR